MSQSLTLVNVECSMLIQENCSLTIRVTGWAFSGCSVTCAHRYLLSHLADPPSCPCFAVYGALRPSLPKTHPQILSPPFPCPISILYLLLSEGIIFRYLAKCLLHILVIFFPISIFFMISFLAVLKYKYNYASLTGRNAPEKLAHRGLCHNAHATGHTCTNPVVQTALQVNIHLFYCWLDMFLFPICTCLLQDQGEC